MNNPQTTTQSPLSQAEPRRRSPGGAFRNMRLNTRLTLIILLVTLPIFILITTTMSNRASQAIEDLAKDDLARTNLDLINNMDIWLKFNYQTLDFLVNDPTIINMDDPASQKSILRAVSTAYPQLFLIHSHNMQGMDVARNDDAELKDYSDREYFIEAASGKEHFAQSLISRTTGNPAISFASPIRDAEGSIIGVLAFATELDEISQNVNVSKVGNTGYAYIVDTHGQTIAHPDPAYTTDELKDLSEYAPVKYLLEGNSGFFSFTDEAGITWQSYVSASSSGYGVVVQQQEQELLQSKQVFRQTSFIGLSIGLLLVLVASWFIIRRTLLPIDTLTQAAQAISAGNLDQHITVRSQDELGVLAETFNTMAARLKGMVGTLESQVQERTRMLQISSEVSRRLSTILNTQQLVREVVEQLKSSFGYYHAHIYLVDPTSQALVMAGGTGEAGQIMLHRGHRLQPGQGLVGKAAESKEAVLVADVEQAEGWLPNPLLPDTRAEAAVPIMLGNEVMGVLDVQHDIHYGLSQQDIDLLQAIANQVAIALRNAQSYEKTQRSVERQSQGGLIAQRIQQATSVDEVLRAAVEGLGNTLQAQRIGVELYSPTERDSAKSN